MKSTGKKKTKVKAQTGYILHIDRIMYQYRKEIRDTTIDATRMRGILVDSKDEAWYVLDCDGRIVHDSVPGLKSWDKAFDLDKKYNWQYSSKIFILEKDFTKKNVKKILEISKKFNDYVLQRNIIAEQNNIAEALERIARSERLIAAYQAMFDKTDTPTEVNVCCPEDLKTNDDIYHINISDLITTVKSIKAIKKLKEVKIHD